MADAEIDNGGMQLVVALAASASCKRRITHDSMRMQVGKIA